MKTIGMVVAVQTEMDAVLKRYGEPVDTKITRGGRILTYQMPTYTLCICNCGAGEIAAAAATQLLIATCGVDMILNFGVVGGLTPAMAKTRTCVVEKVVHYDFDTSPIDPVVEGQYLEYPDVYIPTTPELVDKAVSLFPSLKRVICASADKFVDLPERKAALNTRFSAEICEMEAAGVVLTCNRCGVPCLLIKTVSDSIEGGAAEFHDAIKDTAIICLDIADAIMREL